MNEGVAESSKSWVGIDQVFLDKALVSFSLVGFLQIFLVSYSVALVELSRGLQYGALSLDTENAVTLPKLRMDASKELPLWTVTHVLCP